jgi:hypothetical protein
MSSDVTRIVYSLIFKYTLIFLIDWLVRSTVFPIIERKTALLVFLFQD